MGKGFISLQRKKNPFSVFQEKRVDQGVEHVNQLIFQLQTLFEGLLFSGNFYQCIVGSIGFFVTGNSMAFKGKKRFGWSHMKLFV